MTTSSQRAYLKLVASRPTRYNVKEEAEQAFGKKLHRGTLHRIAQRKPLTATQFYHVS